jgi:hypothetical protein
LSRRLGPNTFLVAALTAACNLFLNTEDGINRVTMRWPQGSVLPPSFRSALAEAGCEQQGRSHGTSLG